MKDKQIAQAAVEPRIFLVSALLHCVSLTALVFLRSSFGFGFLRPKSVFFAFSWAFTLYAIYAWIDGAAWREHRALIVFGVAAIGLYWIHLSIAVIREWRESGEHEQYSGLPHVVWLLGLTGNTTGLGIEGSCRLWGEPAVALALSVVLGLILGEKGLSRWLFLTACCLWSKEAMNRWFQLRSRKRQKDVFADTEDSVEPRTTTNLSPEPPMATRRTKVKRNRVTAFPAVESEKE